MCVMGFIHVGRFCFRGSFDALEILPAWCACSSSAFYLDSLANYLTVVEDILRLALNRGYRCKSSSKMAERLESRGYYNLRNGISKKPRRILPHGSVASAEQNTNSWAISNQACLPSPIQAMLSLIIAPKHV